jgi:hypothetical protein
MRSMLPRSMSSICVWPSGCVSGKPVEQHAHLADAERRARAEAANLDAHVLGEVLATLHQHAGHAIERLLEPDAALSALHVQSLDDADRRGHIAERLRLPRLP